MSIDLTEQQRNLIDRIAKKNGFGEYRVTAVPGSEKGDNFLGILTTVNVTNGDDKLELIMKSAHRNEAFRKATPMREAYLREIYLYETIFEEYKKFEDESNVSDGFRSYPKIYGSSTEDGHEFFVMENLKPQGYQLWNRKVTMNSDHISAVLREYAKFHSISLAIKHKNPEYFGKITEKMSRNIFEESLDMGPEKLKDFIKNALKTGYKAVEGNPILTEFMDKLGKILPDMVMKEMRDPEYKLVALHGDCWCNNFLFKYKDQTSTKTPSSLRILDWQISHIGSPAQDFCYFFLVHSPKEILQNYKSYMQLYHDTLSKQLLNFGCEPDEVFPYATFEKHIKTFMVVQLYFCFMILKIMLCDSEEAPDFVKSSEDDKGVLESMNFRLKNFDLLCERLRILVQFVNDNEFMNEF